MDRYNYYYYYYYRNVLCPYTYNKSALNIPCLRAYFVARRKNRCRSHCLQLIVPPTVRFYTESTVSILTILRIIHSHKAFTVDRPRFLDGSIVNSRRHLLDYFAREDHCVDLDRFTRAILPGKRLDLFGRE